MKSDYIWVDGKLVTYPLPDSNIGRLPLWILNLQWIDLVTSRLLLITHGATLVQPEWK